MTLTREQVEQWFEQHGIARYLHCEVRDLALSAIEQQARIAESERDAARLDWLSIPGRWVEPWKEDEFKSWHEPRKQVHHYINGRYTITKADTLRAAIDAARGKGEG